jgi:hypothetical protein
MVLSERESWLHAIGEVFVLAFAFLRLTPIEEVFLFLPLELALCTRGNLSNR